MSPNAAHRVLGYNGYETGVRIVLRGFVGYGFRGGETDGKLFSAGSRQLLFLICHLPPEDLKVIRNARVIGLLMQGAREPAICGRQVTSHTMPGRIHGAEVSLRLRVAVGRGGAQVGFCAGAVLGQPAAVEVSFSGALAVRIE